jgi:hypothetical protein
VSTAAMIAWPQTTPPPCTSSAATGSTTSISPGRTALTRKSRRLT